MRYHKKHSFLTAKTGYTAQPPYTLPFTEPCFYYLFFRNSSIPFAAALPAPIARITVAAPVTASPPAYTPSLDGLTGLLISDDTFSLVDIQTDGGGRNQRVRRSTKGHDNGIDIDLELRTRNLYRTSSSGCIRLAKLHADAAACRLPSRSHLRESPSGWSADQR